MNKSCEGFFYSVQLWIWSVLLGLMLGDVEQLVGDHPRPTLKNGPNPYFFKIYFPPRKVKNVFISDSQLGHCSQIRPTQFGIHVVVLIIYMF